MDQPNPEIARSFLKVYNGCFLRRTLANKKTAERSKEVWAVDRIFQR
jgi:hypothetical protein